MTRDKQFMSEIASINTYAKELHQVWAKALGVTWPQWTILGTIANLDEDRGVPVNVIAKTLQHFRRS